MLFEFSLLTCNTGMILEGGTCMSYCVFYREYRYKDNVTMVENGTMVSALNVKSFVFLREKSVGDPAVDNITTVNIPAWVSNDFKIK